MSVPVRVSAAITVAALATENPEDPDRTSSERRHCHDGTDAVPEHNPFPPDEYAGSLNRPGIRVLEASHPFPSAMRAEFGPV